MPSPIRYHTNGIRLCVRTSRSVPHTAIHPAMADVITPTIIGPISSSGMPSRAAPKLVYSTAPAITGSDIKKLILTAASRSKPPKRAADIVMPDLDVPGLRASACAAPMVNASRVSKSSILRVPFVWSAHPRMMPKKINDTPMMTGVPSLSSITSANSAPTTAAGTVASSSSHPRRPSGVGGRSRRNTRLSPSRTYTTTSRQKYPSTAMNVPMCSATSNVCCTEVSSKSFHSKSQGTRMRWPLDEIGRNSVRPWTMPRMIAW